MRILLVQRGLIGDMVCLTPTITLIKRYLPNSQIGVLGNPYNIQVLADNPDVEMRFVYKKSQKKNVVERIKNILNFFALKRSLQRWHPDITIIACGYYDYHGLSTLQKMGIKKIIGYESIENKPKPPISFVSPAFSDLHEVEAIANLLIPLGISKKPGAMCVFADKTLKSQIRDTFCISNKANIIIHLSGRTAERRWGIANYKALITGLLASHQPFENILVVWAPTSIGSDHAPEGDDAVAQRLQAEFDDDRLKFVPTSSIAELIATLSLGDLFVGSDGGAMHLACASGLSVVALFDSLPNTLNHWYPWQVPHEILARDAGKIQQISPAEVQSAAERLLAKL